MLWLWIGLGIVGFLLLAALGLHINILWNYIPVLVRIFQEKPLFIIPFGQPIPEAEDVDLNTADGLTLKGCYLKCAGPRKGVILFGPEFGASRWGCMPYSEFLLQNGYDVFSFEMRGQGQSQAQPGYEPLQWLTEYELEDFQTAVEYLKKRPDADARGVGFFGLSKGGSAGLWITAHDSYIRCAVTDGAFSIISTMLPYMKQWIYIYSRVTIMVKIIPHWYFVWIAHIGIGRISRLRNARYPILERVVHKIAPRPWLMIHGGKDNYIKPVMAEELFAFAGEPKEFWLVEKAKHNQAMQTAEEEYKRRVLEFFDRNLADKPAGREGVALPVGQASPNGAATKERSPQTVKV